MLDVQISTGHRKGCDMNGADVVMDLLGDHVPLTLLLDLMAEPRSADLYVDEGGNADWLPAERAGAA
jgi:hypothetical protein